MAIPLTKLHKARLEFQISQNLVGLQRDMRNNALTHRAMAVAQSPDLAKVREFVGDCAKDYLKRLQWHDDISGTTPDVDVLHGALKAEAQGLAKAARESYADIIKACDVVIANVDAPLSLWPE